MFARHEMMLLSCPLSMFLSPVPFVVSQIILLVLKILREIVLTYAEMLRRDTYERDEVLPIIESTISSRNGPWSTSDNKAEIGFIISKL